MPDKVASVLSIDGVRGRRFPVFMNLGSSVKPSPATAPALSVVIPAYQAEATIAETLASVLADPYENMEVVVLDNATTDKTAEVLKGFSDPRLRIERNTDVLPLVENWNRAVEITTGEVVKLVCADDLVVPGTLRRQTDLLRGDPDLALVASHYDFVDSDGKVMVPRRGISFLTGPRTANEVIRSIVRNGANPIGPPCSVVFRRSDFDAVGGWDGRRIFTMDLALWVSLLKRGSFYGEPSTVAKFRVADGTVSGQARQQAYETQLSFTREVADDPQWDVPKADRTIGRLAAPIAKLRRRVLFRLANLKVIRPFER